MTCANLFITVILIGLAIYQFCDLTSLSLNFKSDQNEQELEKPLPGHKLGPDPFVFKNKDFLRSGYTNLDGL